jgi:hypothetical protein
MRELLWDCIHPARQLCTCACGTAKRLVPATSRCGSSSSCHSSRGICPAATCHQLHPYRLCFSSTKNSQLFCSSMHLCMQWEGYGNGLRDTAAVAAEEGHSVGVLTNDEVAAAASATPSPVSDKPYHVHMRTAGSCCWFIMTACNDLL